MRRRGVLLAVGAAVVLLVLVWRYSTDLTLAPAAPPPHGELTRTNAHDDGTFRLVVPPEAPLFVLVAPMERSSGSRMDGSRRDTGRLRADLLPASVRVRGTIGAAHRLDDIVLARAASIRGSVRWLDGAPIALASVRVLPRGGMRFDLDEAACVQWHADGRLSPNAAVDTADDGSFLLPAMPGATVDVAVSYTAEARIVGRFQQQAVAPQRVDFLLSRPVRLRATDGRRPRPHAAIEIADWERVTADATGVFALIPTRALRARASHERLRSPWVAVPLAAAGITIDLEMTNARSEVSIEFTGDFRVRNTVVTWHSDDGQQGREHLLRDDRGGPFSVFFEPGRYQLTVGPGGGERNGVLLLPSEHDVEVGGEPVALRVHAVFGGTFTVMATDSSGVWVGGTCQLRDSNGVDVTQPFRVMDGAHGQQGGPGELLPGGVNTCTGILAPGEYELVCDFGAHGAQRQFVAIRPRHVSEVRIRLP